MEKQKYKLEISMSNDRDANYCDRVKIILNGLEIQDLVEDFKYQYGNILQGEDSVVHLHLKVPIL